MSSLEERQRTLAIEDRFVVGMAPFLESVLERQDGTDWLAAATLREELRTGRAVRRRSHEDARALAGLIGYDPVAGAPFAPGARAEARALGGILNDAHHPSRGWRTGSDRRAERIVDRLLALARTASRPAATEASAPASAGYDAAANYAPTPVVSDPRDDAVRQIVHHVGDAARVAKPAVSGALEAHYGPDWLSQVNAARARDGKPWGAGLFDPWFVLEMILDPAVGDLFTPDQRRAAAELRAMQALLPRQPVGPAEVATASRLAAQIAVGPTRPPPEVPPPPRPAPSERPVQRLEDIRARFANASPASRAASAAADAAAVAPRSASWDGPARAGAPAPRVGPAAPEPASESESPARAPSPATAPRARTSSMAVWSLVLGVLWIGGLGSFVAMILGGMSIDRIGASNGAQRGRGIAYAGLILGIVGVVGTVLSWILTPQSDAWM